MDPMDPMDQMDKMGASCDTSWVSLPLTGAARAKKITVAVYLDDIPPRLNCESAASPEGKAA